MFISYDELIPGKGFPSIKSYISESSYPNQGQVISFLKNGEVEFVQHSRDRDIFTGELIPYEVRIMSDEEFCWSSVLVWYVERYNLRLPKEFEAHILDR